MHAAVSPAEYDAAIRAARDGQTAAAIEKLRTWHRANPKDARIVHDLATVLGMAGLHDAALQYYGQVVHPDAPPYAIKSLAGSARAAGHVKEAEVAYQLLISKTPDDVEAHTGLAYAWMAQDRVQAALDYVKTRLPRTAAEYTRLHAPLLVALAELYERREEWLLAAAAYQDVLNFEPNFRYALRGRVFALNRAGAFHLAKRLSDSSSEAFDAEEMRRLAHDAAARTVVFGQVRLALDDKPTRYTITELALFENAEVTRRFGEKADTQFDRLVALRDRLRMREAVDLYESLAVKKADVPPYARTAAADAYLYLGRPEIARDLYLSALNGIGGVNLAEAADWQVALMYAYSEAEQHDDAEALADRLLSGTAPIGNKGIRGIESPNADYARAALMAALMRLYAGRLEQAQQRLAELRTLAPFNVGHRAAWASLQSARERPRAALEEFTRLQLDEPASVDAAVGRAETLLALNRFDEASAALLLFGKHADNRAVQNLARKFENHDSLHLKIDTMLGRGASAAGAESVLNAALHSAPLKESLGTQYRVFSRLSRAEGETAGTSVSRTRIGAGVDYRASDIHAEVEINHAVGAADRKGLALAMAWSLSDAWHAHIALDTNVNELSAAALRNGMTARSLRTGVTWIDHESRKAAAELARTRLSDDNTRDAAHLWWTERWISGPAFKLETTLAFAASTNSLSGTVYFNPAGDHETSLTFAGECLSWRRYHRSFRQRLAYTLIITHKSLVASHDEKHVGNVGQMLEAAPQYMRSRRAITFAGKEAAKPGNPQHRFC